MKIKFCLEQIGHFSCPCGKWFSISEFNPKKVKTLTCPQCGKTRRLEKLKPYSPPLEEKPTKTKA